MIGRQLRRLGAAAFLVLLSVHGVDAAPVHTQSIFRDTAFSTQATNYLCTSAVVQNIRNLATGELIDSREEQIDLYYYGKEHNRYDYRSQGVDPQGVEAMLEHVIPGSDWQQVRKKSLQGLLRTAARRMRATGLPAVLFVAGGRHVWTMNGYTSSRDPAVGGWFKVTHVQFSGPYFPRQRARYGWFDLKPNYRASVDRLSRAFYRYQQRQAFGYRRPTIWNSWYVAVIPWTYTGNPDPGETPTPPPDPTAEPTFGPSPEVTPEAPPE